MKEIRQLLMILILLVVYTFFMLWIHSKIVFIEQQKTIQQQERLIKKYEWKLLEKQAADIAREQRIKDSIVQ